MGNKNGQYAHSAFGETNRADGVPDCPEPEKGPVYLEGRLVLSLSFQGTGEGPCLADEPDGVIERYRLWDDLSEAWHDNSVEVLRFEQVDVVVSSQPRPTVLWKGAIDTKARVIPEPDLDTAGLIANQRCDLCWRCV